MEYHLAASEEFQDLRKRLLKELTKLYKISKLDRSPIFIRLLEKKIELIADTSETIDRNPSMTMRQLSHHIEVSKN